uniref:Uncharacterized protein n=1 Tax=Arion vulgaris TaxID=1028688 RepID=A0A0B7BU25_9EUPU
MLFSIFILLNEVKPNKKSCRYWMYWPTGLLQVPNTTNSCSKMEITSLSNSLTVECNQLKSLP